MFGKKVLVEISDARFDVLTEVMLVIGGFWDMTLCPFGLFEESSNLNVQGSGSSSLFVHEDSDTRNPENVDLVD